MWKRKVISELVIKKIICEKWRIKLFVRYMLLFHRKTKYLLKKNIKYILGLVHFSFILDDVHKHT